MDPADKFVIEENEKVGRYNVASEDLKPGDLIFTETPFAYGPKSETYCVCLGCHATVDCKVLCSKCQWPVCDSDCENLTCHKDFECPIFSQTQVKFQPVEDPSNICSQYQCITPLRVLLAKEKDPERWEREVACMEAHNDIRKSKPIWEFNQKNVVDFIRNDCKLDKFAEELIHSACGFLEVNAFEARTISGTMIRCLYPKFGISSHNCVSNLHYSIDGRTNGENDDFRVFVRAAVEIPKGGELFSCYTYSLWPTLIRRKYLKESKYFDCTCERCQDRTELGTHTGSLKCQSCADGIVLSTNPLDFEAEWQCNNCDYIIKSDIVLKVFASIQAELDAVEYIGGLEGIEARERIFKKYGSILHPNNGYITMLRSALGQLYGKVDGYGLEDLPDLLLERKADLCQQLLDVINVIRPGSSRMRGITLYELHGPLMMLARYMYQNGEIDKDAFREKLKKAVDILGQSVEILKNEPESQPEGQLGLMMSMAHQQLQENFELLVETA